MIQYKSDGVGPESETTWSCHDTEEVREGLNLEEGDQLKLTIEKLD